MKVRLGTLGGAERIVLEAKISHEGVEKKVVFAGLIGSVVSELNKDA